MPWIANPWGAGTVFGQRVDLWFDPQGFGESSPGDGTGGVVYHSTMAPNQTALRIARGQNNPRSLAIGPAKVYWSTSDCTVESQNL